MAQGFSLKDQLFNHQTVSHLGGLFEAAGVFRADPFVGDVMARMPALALKARINLIAEVLARYLPPDFAQSEAAILAALPPVLDPQKTDNDFGHFIYAPLGVYVENHGMSDLPRSLDLLEALTQRFSMEFSVRAFLNANEDAVLERMQDWVSHDHYHVRRLVSEGTRPRLPWGRNVGLTSDQTMPLLDRLHADQTRFVIRSVANHLNDITKKEPGSALSLLKRWREVGKQDAKELDWLTRHALRGLVKAGHPGAMTHLGFAPDVTLRDATIKMDPIILARGQSAEMTVEICADISAPLIVDYVIDFVRGSGKVFSKVFKMKALEVKAKVPVVIKKRHTFRNDATTFTLHPGAHQVHLQVNGRIVASQAFTLT